MAALAILSVTLPAAPSAAEAAPPSVTAVSPPAGPLFGGTDVVLTGSGFTGASAVRFGLVPAAGFEVTSDTRIVAASPAQPADTVVHVQVTTPAGTSPASAEDTFTYARGDWAPAGTMALSSRGPATLLPSGKVLVAACTLLGGEASGNTFSNRDCAVQWEREDTAGGQGRVDGAALYDPARGDAGWSLTEYLPQRAHWPTATALGAGDVLLAGSAVVDGSAPLAYRYRPGQNVWTDVTGAMASGRRQHSATLLPGGKVLVAGGTRTTTYFDGATTAASTTHTSASPRFTGADLGRGITGPGLPDGTVIAGVIDSTTVTLSAPATVTASDQEFTLSPPTAELYDPADGGDQGAWSPTGFMTAPRRGHTATLLQTGQVLVTGGYRDEDFNDPLASAEIYDPGTRTWRQTGSMGRSRRDHTATLLANGDVLVVGGAGTSAEVYRDGSWRPTGALGTFRFDKFTATALSDGSVLVAGGSGPSGALAASELYDPGASAVVDGVRVDGGWRPTTWLPAPRFGHTATALADGRVLVAGGVGPGFNPDNGQPVTAVAARGAVIFDPAPPGRPPAEVVAVDPPSGPPEGGTTVTITGRSLSPAPTVRFGDVPAIAVTVLSDTRITAVAPPQARGDVDVTVTTSAGTSRRGILFSYGAGRWKAAEPLTGCAADGPRSCKAREAHASVLLDGSPCRERVPPPAWCGQVLAIGGGAAFTDGEVVVTTDPESSKILRSDSADFAPADVSRPIVGTHIPPGTTVARFVSENVIELSAPVVGFADGPGDDVIGGIHFTHHVGATQLYDPSTGTWAPTGSMAVERSFDPLRPRIALPTVPFTTTLLPSGEVLVTGGCCPGPHDFYVNRALRSAEIYDPDTGTWRPAASMGSGAGGPPVPEPCPAGEDPPLGCVTPARMNHTATLLDGPACGTGAPPGWCAKVLVVGGISDHFAKTSAELYDPETDTWTWASDTMSYARAGHTASLLPDGTVLVTGGVGCWAEDPDPQKAGNCASPKIDATAGNEQRSADLVSAERFDPDRLAWDDAPAMATKRTGHTATLLEAGACGGGCPLLVAGGRESFTGNTSNPDDPLSAREPLATTSAELFDPVRGVWTSAQPMYHSRLAHTATRLADGRVLVTGGWAGANAVDASTEGEIYDPVGGGWEVTTPMAGGGAAAGLTDPRRSHTATLLQRPSCDGGFVAGYPCGKVLVAGGSARAKAGDLVPDGSEERFSFASAAMYTPGPHVTAVTPREGRSAGGEQVTISGANFQAGPDGTTVSFGGSPAPNAEVASPADLVVRTPAHVAGPVTVTVETTEGGTSATLHPQPAAVFTFVVSEGPGALVDLAAEGVSDSEVALSFSAVTSDGGRPPPARRYVVKQASSPIVDAAGFSAAATLCGGECTYVPAAVGDRLTLAVGGLAPGTTYHFAAVAVNEAGLAGPLSNPASATTTGRATTTGPATAGPGPGAAGGATAATCGPVRPGPSQVALPGGYSLVGLPGGTGVGRGTVYGWFDQGAGARYSTHDPSGPLTEGRGYWAWSPCPYLARASSAGQPNLSMPLGAYRASLVANPWASGPVTVSGFDYAARWDQTLNAGKGGYHLSGFREPQRLAVGEGIWVFSYTAATIRMAP